MEAITTGKTLFLRMGGRSSSSGLGNSRVSRYEDVKGLVFGTAHITDSYIDIDGYSNKKTEAGALKDLAKAVDQYDTGEGDVIRNMVTDNEIMQIHPDRSVGGSQYILEWENVPGASRINEVTDEVEYKNGRWYLHVRFIR